MKKIIFKKLSKLEKLALMSPPIICIEAELFPIENSGIIPENALDNTIWDIPNGYYAIKIEKRD